MYTLQANCWPETEKVHFIIQAYSLNCSFTLLTLSIFVQYVLFCFNKKIKRKENQRKTNKQTKQRKEQQQQQQKREKIKRTEKNCLKCYLFVIVFAHLLSYSLILVYNLIHITNGVKNNHNYNTKINTFRSDNFFSFFLITFGRSNKRTDQQTVVLQEKKKSPVGITFSVL